MNSPNEKAFSDIRDLKKTSDLYAWLRNIAFPVDNYLRNSNRKKFSSKISNSRYEVYFTTLFLTITHLFFLFLIFCVID